MHIDKILLASHNTPGAQAAESVAMALATQFQAAIEHLVVVPDFWKGMIGDDWLNNAATQAQYGDYLESELEREIVQHVQRLGEIMTAKKIAYEYQVRFGRPDKILIEVAQSTMYNLIVMGSIRPKGVDGFRSRMLTDRLHKMGSPLLIIPFPLSHE